ncbi:MAG: hypothetical protein GX851_00355 [Clostridiales bacterium]|nr:hypothetical protein [Clostridiales bacterium]
MLKRHGLKIFIVVIILQLCVPSGMIGANVIHQTNIINRGTLYKFKLESVHYEGYNASENKITFTIDNSAKKYRKRYFEIYAEISEGDDGYALMSMTEDKPRTKSYIKSSYAHEFFFPEAYLNAENYSGLEYCTFSKEGKDIFIISNTFFEDQIRFKEAYAEIYVYKGDVSVKEIYIDGVPVDIVLSRLNAAQGNKE